MDWAAVCYWKGSLTVSLRCQFPFGQGIANVILRVLWFQAKPTAHLSAEYRPFNLAMVIYV